MTQKSGIVVDQMVLGGSNCVEKFYIVYLEYHKLFYCVYVLSHYEFINKIAPDWVDPVNCYPEHNMKPPTSEIPAPYTRNINIIKRSK